MQRRPSGGAVVAAAHGLAVDGDRVERRGPAGAHPVHEAGGEQARIDPVHHDVEPAPRGNAPVEGQESPQEREMGLSPVGDGVETVAFGDRGAHAHKQNLVQLVRHAFRTALVLDPGEMIKQKPQPRRLGGSVRRGVHEQAPNQEPHKFSLRPTRKSPLTRVRSPGQGSTPIDIRVAARQKIVQRVLLDRHIRPPSLRLWPRAQDS